MAVTNEKPFSGGHITNHHIPYCSERETRGRLNTKWSQREHFMFYPLPVLFMTKHVNSKRMCQTHPLTQAHHQTNTFNQGGKNTLPTKKNDRKTNKVYKGTPKHKKTRHSYREEKHSKPLSQHISRPAAYPLDQLVGEVQTGHTA